MKILYCVLVLSLVSGFISSQDLQVSLNNKLACEGESITASVKGPQLDLATPASSANNNSGVMFDVVASKSVTITGFTASPIFNGTDFEVYYRVGSFVGHETSSAGWILLDSSSSISAGTSVNIGVNLSRPIIAGQTLGFYITSTTTGNFIYYDNGTAVGNSLASDSYLTIEEGVGKGYPFGSTNTTRNFVGSILYEPKVTGLSWNISSDTLSSTSFTATRSTAVTATGFIGSSQINGHDILEVTDMDVNVQANPASIQSGQSSTLSSTITETTGLATTFDAGNNQNGAMFDVVATADAEIKGFSISAVSGSPDVEIFYKTGTHVGFEASAASWTSLGTFSNVDSMASAFLALPNPLSIINGQTLAFYITRTDGNYLYYTDGAAVGTVVNSDAVLQIEEGIGLEYPFGNTFSPRILNTIVHYEIENPTGTLYNWSPSGGSGGSVNVSPTATTTYTLDAELKGCVESASVTVVVDGIDLDEDVFSSLEVYPNPAHHLVNITWAKGADVSEVVFYDVQGKLVYKEALGKEINAVKIPVDHLERGLYLLQVKAGDKLSSHKLHLR